MDATVYPPARQYEAPFMLPRPHLNVADWSIAELLDIPAARTVVVKHQPIIAAMAGNPTTVPMLGLLRIADIAVFTTDQDQVVLDSIDEELKSIKPIGD